MEPPDPVLVKQKVFPEKTEKRPFRAHGRHKVKRRTTGRARIKAWRQARREQGSEKSLYDRNKWGRWEGAKEHREVMILNPENMLKPLTVWITINCGKF